jgi:formate hydrogenlyase subunit 3/multisubunit Na+/H+ antiporter MnhD subunit
VVFSVLAPVFAIGALVAIKRGSRPLVAWGITAALVAALSGSSFVALETGEDQEEAVENVVPGSALDTHEDAADRFFTLSLVLLGVTAAGFLPRRAGTAARLVATAGTLVMVVAGYEVGHSGGSLVYEHNAGSAYTKAADGTNTAATAPEGDVN